MRKLNIELKDHSYDIYIEEGLLFHLNKYIKNVYKEKKIFIITDDKVASFYLDTVVNSLSSDYEVDYVIIPNGEESKNINVYADVCEKLITKGIRRNYLLLALGGGVVGDLTGFIASTLFRGLPYIGVPTSLLSQMDSSIGGKTGIDFNGRKNIIGAFKQPLMVLIDPNSLNTLEKCEFNNGMGELIKHGAIGNKKLLNMLVSKPCINEDIIYESLTVKKKLVELDEFDLKERMFLNFGHTFGHAVELKLGYKHGEAVAVGMLMALKMGIDLGVTEKYCYDLIENVIKLYELPCDLLDYKDYLKDAIYDKKNLAGKVRFILISDIGKPFMYEIKEEELL